MATNNANIGDIIKIPETVLGMTGLWPTKKRLYLYQMRKLTVFIIAFLFCITMLIGVFYCLNDFLELAPILCYTTTANCALVKVIFVVIKGKKLEKIIEFFKSPIFSKHDPKYDFHVCEAVREFTIVAQLYLGSCTITVVLSVLQPLFDGDAYPLWFPFDWGKTVYFIQANGAICCSVMGVCVDLLIAGLLSAAVCHLNILHEELADSRKNALEKSKNFNEKNVEKLLKKELKKCVQHHCQIISYVRTVEDIFSFLFLVQFYGSIIVICNTVFCSVLLSPKTTKFASVATFFVAMMVELGMYCWYGDEIMVKSSTIHSACYEMEWYECSPKIRRLLLIIMETSKKPLAVSACGYLTLSVQTFGLIMQSAYSYFNVLNRMYSERNEAVDDN